MSWGKVHLSDGEVAELRLGDDGVLDHSEPWTSLRLPSGHSLLVPTEALVLTSGSYHLPISLRELGLDLRPAPDSTVFPIIEEELEVSRRRVDVSRVLVRTVLEQHPAVVEEVLLSETVEVERVPMDVEVGGPQPVRYEGDTMIIPVVEEVLVVQKRFILKEEVRVLRRSVELPARQEVTLRKQTAEVIRESLDGLV